LEQAVVENDVISSIAGSLRKFKDRGGVCSRALALLANVTHLRSEAKRSEKADAAATSGREAIRKGLPEQVSELAKDYEKDEPVLLKAFGALVNLTVDRAAR
jgi:hypothetical protein